MSLNSGTSSTPQCSICLDYIITGNGRSTATLSCSHLFHLDCIGSEFNCKGVMQCPNCRLVEQGNWRFAAGNFLQDIMNDDRDDQENNPRHIDRERDTLHDFLRNEFLHPPVRTIRSNTQRANPPVITEISQFSQNVRARQTHQNPLSNSLSITIGTPSGHEIGITLGTSSPANRVHPWLAPHQSRPQDTGSSGVQNILTAQQQQTSGPAAPMVPVRAQMSQNIVQGSHNSVPLSAFFTPVFSRQPPTQATFVPNEQPSEPDGDDNNVPMFRFL